MNNYLKLSAAGALVVAMTNAWSFNPTTTAADIELHHAGASASSSTFFNNVRQLCVGDADIFVDDGVIANAANGLDSANTFTGNYWVVACEVNESTIPLITPGGGSGAAGNYRLLYYKRDAGGSGVGVYPVAAQSNVAFMGIDSTNCPTVGTADNFHECTGYVAGPGSLQELAPPELGSSDVEPQLFDALLNTPAGIDYNNDGDSTEPNPAANLASLTAEPAGLLGFGVVVNTRMYTGLQYDQFDAGSGCHPDDAGYDITNINSDANKEHCMPTMTSESITSLFLNGRQVDEIEEIIEDLMVMPGNSMDGDPSDDVTTGNVDPLENLTDHKIQICRRVRGSGTQAQHNLTYYNYPCDIDSDGGFDLAEPAEASVFFNDVTENSGSSDLARCLRDYNIGGNEKGANPGNRTRWAIGLQSLTRTDSFSRQFRYVKIDGVAPTIGEHACGTL